MKKKKITLKEFWNSKEKLCIHCNTEKKANILLGLFDRMGKRWSEYSSYLENNEWHCYEADTCYTNKGTFANIDFFKENHHTIYEFEEVEIEVNE